LISLFAGEEAIDGRKNLRTAFAEEFAELVLTVSLSFFFIF
jgi:hypothetical protein